MRRSFLLFFLLCLYASVSDADQALWNCSQNKDSKEWVCVGEKKPAEKNGTVKPPASAESLGKAQESPVKDELPAPVPAEVVETTPPVMTEPERAQSQTSPAEKAELPVSTQADKNIQPTNIEAEQVAQSPAQSDSRRGSGDKKLLQTDANRPGWTCGAKTADKKWDCKLVGADPKGQAQIIETAESGVSLLTPAFDHSEEQTFGNLKSQLRYDPWQNCAAPGLAKPGFASEKGLRASSPLDINSDYAEIFDNEIYSYSGNVEMTRADQRSVSNKASYDTVSETLDLQGSVYYNEDELALHSDSASLNLASDRARLREALFIAPGAPLRGRAKAIYRESATLSRYKDVAYTSCRPGNQDWVVHASELKMNKTNGQGSAKNAWVEFKGAPVFYSPYLSFPIDDRRLSGFLAPSFGRTQRGGLSLSVPYYWNIAPNYDATLSPRYLSNRGVILGGNFRYLNEISKGNTSFEFMPNDRLRDKYRYLLSFKDTAQFTNHISSDINLNKVSDKEYFSDLGNALSTTTYSSYLLSQGNLGYVREGISLKGHADSYQSIDKSITPLGMPYRRLPQINLKLNHSFDFMPLDTLMDTEYVYFQHDARVNGQRTNVKPSISFPLQTASAYLTPKLSVQHTEYLLNNPKGGTVLTKDSMSRTLPIFSADSGFYMEKDVNISNKSYLNTLEPRLFYLYVPRTDQRDMPIFDSALYDFSFNSMFLENRFSGKDRVQDANQLTAAITTRLVDARSGKERLKLGVGQIAYFQDREVTLNSIFNPPNYPIYRTETHTLSPLVTELNAGLTDHLSTSSGVQWDPKLNQVVRHNTMLHYINKPDINKPGEIVNVGYRYRKNTLIPIPVGTPPGVRPYDIFQSDVSVHWPVYNDWSAVGRWTYSLLNNSTQESFIGVEKENCCWAFRVIGRRWINSVSLNQNPNVQSSAAINANASGTSQTGVFFEVELKGLTGIGEKLDNFFEQQIYGYRKPQND